MSLKNILSEQSVRPALPGQTKRDIINELVSVLVQCDPDLDRQVVLKAVLDREAQMSTGMKNGIAIPHGKTDQVSRLHAVVAVSENPVDFDSIDGKPSSIFVMTLSPASITGPHLQFLAEISSLLSDSKLRHNILNARTRQSLLDIFLAGTLPYHE